MQREDYIYKDERTIRVSKRVARQLYNKGVQVWLIQGLLRLDIAWQNPLLIDNKNGRDFDEVVAEFRDCHCEKKMPKDVKYFVRKVEYDKNKPTFLPSDL